MSSSEEFYCHFPSVDVEKKYTYATIYARYPNQKKHIVAVGVIALSDSNKDHFILQFFKDEDINRFFQNKIINKFKIFTEDWLAEVSCVEYEDNFFFGTPFVLTSDSAEKICRIIHDKYEANGYVIKDDHEKWL